METARIEHVNITVSDPAKTADMLCSIFGWQVRWQGEALNGGHTIHVGSDVSYVAVYTPKRDVLPHRSTSITLIEMNHIGVVVDDLDAVEGRVIAAGFTPINHADYEPGRRFYFHDHDNVEYEVVSYSTP